MTLHVVGLPLPEGLAQILGSKPAPVGDSHKLEPASIEQIRPIIEAARQPKFALGDIVELRPHAYDIFKMPTAGDRVIVTQVLEKPLYGDPNTSSGATPSDIAIGFTCSKGHVHEFLHDSRNFVKVGSIYD